jgi:methionine-gamma-lyase
MEQIRAYRTFFGSMAGPWTGWLLMRSLETLKLRMTATTKNARYVADYLAEHPKVDKVYYLGHLTEDDPQWDIYRKQCVSPGAMMAFDLHGGEAAAFRFLNALKLFKLAVSLGGTESLAEHPASMTHADISPAERERHCIGEGLVRLSIGVEAPEDQIADVEQALEAV